MSVAEQLIEQFYAWERRGRGWRLWSYPVALEPPFIPFLYHEPLQPPQAVDDGRRPGILSSIFESLQGRSASATGDSAMLETLEEAPEPAPEDADLIEVEVTIPPDLKVQGDVAEQLLLNCAHAYYPLSFEILGTPQFTTVQLVCHREDRRLLGQQLEAFFPEAVVTDQLGVLAGTWDRRGAVESVVVDFGLSNEFMLPLRTFTKFDPDPLIGIMGALADLRDGELGVLQVLFQSTRYPWPESILRSVVDGEGGAFFSDAPQFLPSARRKVERPLFAAVLRVATQSPHRGRAWKTAQALGGALRSLADPTSNEFIPLANDGYPDRAHELDLLLRRSHRSGMLLNSEELVSLVHLPSVTVRSAKLKREVRRSRPAPAVSTGHELVLGTNVHGGAKTRVTLSPALRMRHTYVIGTSGTGKSTLLLNLILQDIEGGQGVGVLDPHGDLIDQILGHIPDARADEVVLLDAGDAEYSVGFNILSAKSELEANLIASDLVGVFQRLSTSWGDQMTSVLGNAILAFLESDRGGTIVDLRRFLVEPDFRREFLTTVRDPQVVYYWQKEFTLLAGKPQAPILTRLNTFLRPKPIRFMVSQQVDKLNLGSAMNSGKIFLAKLAQGAIGEENAYLLGALIVSKFHQLALARQELAQADRRPFWLYIDEFHHFITPSMASILSGARKYHLGLTLAHQELRQLAKGDEEVLSAVLSNPATRICFRVGDQDAKKLAEGFSYFTARDLQNLGVGEALVRLERAEQDFNLLTAPLPRLDPATAQGRRERLVALSRQRYATPRAVLEAELQEAVARATQPEAQSTEPVPSPRARAAKTNPTPEAPAEAPAPVLPPRPVARPQVVPTPSPELPRPTARTPGRGGQQHKYLQNLIKRWGEDRGFRVMIEKTILGGVGCIDVLLEREGASIACEIAVGSTPELELGNVQKCLATEATHVVSLSADSRLLAKTRDLVTASIDQAMLARVQFLSPEGFFSFVDSLGEAPKTTTVRGYKVKVQRKAVLEKEQKLRKEAISSVLLSAMKRMKE